MEVIIYITAIILFVTGTFLLVRRVVRIVSKFDSLHDSAWDLSMELITVYVLPCIGICTTNDPCSEHPFDLNGITTTITLWVLFSLAHFFSKFFKEKFSPLALLTVVALLIMGVTFCSVITIHFLSQGFAALIPFIQFLYVSPLLCVLYLLRELTRLSNYLRTSFQEANLGASSVNYFYQWLEKYHLVFAIYLLAPLLALIQTLLYLFGQRADSLITQFTNSCGYVLSIQQSCSCGGDHYLCSIAANGTRTLVQPVRMGWRQNEKILVNRQLLVANAFENWMEEFVPHSHRLIRKAYDGCNIPVNAWSKNKRFANLLYILMKPLEWFFLLWLYLFDKNPENRIATQYLPKKELENFIKIKNL